MPWSVAAKRQGSAHLRTMSTIERALRQVQRRRQSGGSSDREDDRSGGAQAKGERNPSVQRLGFFDLLIDDDVDKSLGDSPGRPADPVPAVPGGGRRMSEPEGLSELGDDPLRPFVKRLSDVSALGLGVREAGKRSSVPDVDGGGLESSVGETQGAASPRKYKSRQKLLALNAKLFGYTPASAGEDSLTSTYGGRAHIQDERRSIGMIHPLSPFRTRWDILAMTLAVVIIFLVPFRVCFDRAFAEDEIRSYDTALLVFDAFFLVDIVLNFNTGRIHHEDRVVVMSRRKVARMYLRGWFAIDILSSFPWFLLEVALDSQSPGMRLSELPPTLLALRLLRCLKLFRLSHIARHAWLAREKLAIGSSYVYIPGLVSAFTIFSHWNACAQFLVVEIDGFREDSWVVREGMVNPETLEVQTTSTVLYVWSLFKALSHMLSIGYGHGDTPGTMAEVIATMISMVLGASVYACLIGIITALSMHVGQDQLEYSQRMDRVNRLMARMALPMELRTAVRESYEHRKRTHRLQDDSETLRDLPLPLKADIAMYNCRELLESVPFFADNDAGFIASVVTMLKPTMFLPGQVIFCEGSIGQEMFFVRSGEVEVSVARKVAAVLPPGSYFGEIALLTRTRRTATVRCTLAGPCELYSLSISDFKDVEIAYPEVKEALKVVAEHRLTALEFLVTPEAVSNRSSASSSGLLTHANIDDSDHAKAYEKEHDKGHVSDSDEGRAPQRGRLSESRIRRLDTLEKYVSMQGPGSRILFGDLYRHIKLRRRRSLGVRGLGTDEGRKRSGGSKMLHLRSSKGRGKGDKGKGEERKAPFIREILDMEQRYRNDPRRKKTINGQDIIFPLFMPNPNPTGLLHEGGGGGTSRRARGPSPVGVPHPAATPSISLEDNAETSAKEIRSGSTSEDCEPVDWQRISAGRPGQDLPIGVPDTLAGLPPSASEPSHGVQPGGSVTTAPQTSPRWEGAVQARFPSLNIRSFPPPSDSPSQRPAAPPPP